LLAENLENNATKTSDPVTLIQYTNSTGVALTANIALGHFAGPKPGDIKIVVFDDGAGATVAHSPLNQNNGTIYGHHAAPGSLAIAADDYSFVYQNGVFPEVEPYSSAGPTKFSFDDAGNRLAAPEVRAGPAVTGIDGGDTTFLGADIDGDGFPNFFGTSAAAASIAAVAALLVQADRTLTDADIRNILSDSAADVFSAPGTARGPDRLTGAGVVNAAVAVNEAISHTFTVQPGQVRFLGTHENDTFSFDNLVFGERPGVLVRGKLVAADRIDGGAGTDTVSLDGNYTGTSAVVFGSATMVSIERVTLAAGFSYDLTIAGDTAAPGKTLTVDGSALGSGARLIFDGAPEIEGKLAVTGGAGNDVLTGGSRNDVLTGGAGNDVLNGSTGNDVLTGATGDDVLNGGAGNEVLNGGAGNDVLIGDAGNDVLTAGAGNDVLTGGAGNDVLTGGAGNDVLIGGLGNDVYDVDNAGDGVIEAAGQGVDTVRTTLSSYTLGANVEKLLFTGARDFRGTGNGLSNIITGGSGNDRLDGRGGNDVLSGRGGHDSFVFDSTLNAKTNVDQIVDFNVAQDKILLSRSVFTDIRGSGALAATEFFIGSRADDAAERVIYAASTGALSYDPDGSGRAASTQFATLSPRLDLTHANFVIV
jgi:Ca2+-binding RTX toxin-like protein